MESTRETAKTLQIMRRGAMTVCRRTVLFSAWNRLKAMTSLINNLT